MSPEEGAVVTGVFRRIGRVCVSETMRRYIEHQWDRLTAKGIHRGGCQGRHDFPHDFQCE